MNIAVDEHERALILELIENAERDVIQSIDHADVRAFKDLLRTRLDLLESLKARLQVSPAASGIQPQT